MNCKKICFITTVPMAVTAFLQSHIERLADDYEVFVASNYGAEPVPQDERVTYLNVSLAREISPWTDLKTLFALVRLFRRHRFDAVHSVTPKAGLLGMLAARLTGVPRRIHWFTGQVWVTRTGPMRRVLKAADKVIAGMASHRLADGPFQRDFLVAEGVCRVGEIEVIGDGSISGVDSLRFRPDAEARERIRKEHGIAPDAVVVLYLGRLTVEKGLREMAQAMLLLDEHHPSLHWLVTGPDEAGMADHIRSVAGRLGERLHFQGFTREPQAYMAAADVFCLPSYREGFNNSVLEAAAVGIPTVASRIYGLTDAIEDGVSGLLVPPADAPALAAALQRLLNDAQARRIMGQAARERALELFSRERIVEGLAAFYRRLFGKADPA